MILSDMISRIQRGIQDPSFTVEDDILPLIQEAIETAAHELPHAALATSDVIDVDAEESGPLSLPEDYHHDVYRVENVTHNRPVNIRTNVEVLDRLYDGLESPGPIADVAVEGQELYFQPNPATADQQLKVFYYAKPEPPEIDDVDYEPEWLPERLHNTIIVDYALKELFGLIEDGIDGQKVNTAFYEARYARGRQQLEKHTRQNPRQKPIIKRTARFF